ncbi:MAG: anthranilate synthase component I, partial [Phycisphaerae bacterium]|nr:anthranilate synthase component I [Phycisphaerae bacterium]
MQLYAPDYEHFKRLAAGHNRVPITSTLICDDLTPVSAFARLEVGADYAFLFESVIGGEKIARYSFIGADPCLTFEAEGKLARFVDHRRATVREVEADDPLAVFAEHLEEYRVVSLPGLPRLLGGAVGYAGYDVVRYYERLEKAPPDDRGYPDVLFNVYDTMVIFDHVFKTVHVVALADIGHGSDDASLRAAYDRAVNEVDRMIERLGEPLALRPVQISLPMVPLTRYESNFERHEFEEVVERCREYIRAGDIFQVVVS